MNTPKQMILEQGDHGPERISFDGGKTFWRLCWVRMVSGDDDLTPDLQFLDHGSMLGHVEACEASGVIRNPEFKEQPEPTAPQAEA